MPSDASAEGGVARDDSENVGNETTSATSGPELEPEEPPAPTPNEVKKQQNKPSRKGKHKISLDSLRPVDLALRGVGTGYNLGLRGAGLGLRAVGLGLRLGGLGSSRTTEPDDSPSRGRVFILADADEGNYRIIVSDLI